MDGDALANLDDIWYDDKQQLVHIRTTTSLHKNIVQSQQETGTGSREAGNNRKTP